MNFCRVKFYYFLIVFPVIFTGCATILGGNNKILVSPEQARLETEKRISIYKNLVNECEKDKWTRENANDKQICLNQAELYNPDFSLNSEMRLALDNKNLQLALDFSEGKISEKRFILLKQENLLRAVSVQDNYNNQRYAQQRQEFMQQQQIEEIRKMRMSQALQNVGQNFQNNRPVTTNCYAVGNSLNCTSR